MKKLLALAGLLLLAGCAATPNSANDSSQKADPPSRDEVVKAYCETFETSREAYFETVKAVMGEEGSFDPDAWSQLDSQLSELNPIGLETEWIRSHNDYLSFQRQVNEALKTEGAFKFESTDFKVGSMEIMVHCGDEGFTASGGEPDQ